MDVKFVSNLKGVVVIPCPEISEKHVIRFRRSYTTQDKQEIKKLLSDSFAREKTELAPGQDLADVADYLDSDNREDVMTKEYLNSIPFDAWKEIMDVRSDVPEKFPLVGLAKGRLEGLPLTSEIEEIVEKFKNKPSEAQAKVEKAKEVDKEQTKKAKVNLEHLQKKKAKKAGEGKKSTDMNARPAADYITAAPEGKLEGFIAEDEDRKTVFRAWNERFPDNQYEIPED